jgi:hypothetical protein
VLILRSSAWHGDPASIRRQLELDQYQHTNLIEWRDGAAMPILPADL